MGISEGKIELYTAAAGVDPAVCLPVCLDVGTNNQQLREHPAYRGRRAARATGYEYDSFVDEVMTALQVGARGCACVNGGRCINELLGRCAVYLFVDEVMTVLQVGAWGCTCVRGGCIKELVVGARVCVCWVDVC